MQHESLSRSSLNPFYSKQACQNVKKCNSDFSSNSNRHFEIFQWKFQNSDLRDLAWRKAHAFIYAFLHAFLHAFLRTFLRNISCNKF